jgi:hypothetical protein
MIRIFTFCSLLLLLSMTGWAQFTVGVQVNVVQPVPPYLPQLKADIMGNRAGQLNQDISSHLSIILRYSGRSQQRVKLAGSIERISPAVMGVSLRPDFQPAQPLLLGPAQPILSLTRDMLQTSFGNFNENSLVYTNCDLNTLRQNGVDFKLPEGTYRVCVMAYDYDRPGFSAPLSAPGTGCAYFTICYTASAPQLIMPVSTFVNATGGFQDLTPHSNLVQFTWTPPSTTCGLPMGPLTYELDIRRVFAGQTVTDAVNNPYVFHQQNIPVTTFLLDTLKYGHVLVPGQQYIVRVKANFLPMIGSPLEVANQGWSEIGAFNWAPVSYFPTTSLAVNTPTPDKPVPPGSIQPGGYINEPYTPVSACAVATPVGNTTPLSGSPAGQQVTIDGFTMTVSQATANSDGSYKGSGTIAWHPFSSDIKLNVTFDSLRVNTDKVVYAGEAQTVSDNSFPGWSVFGAAGVDPVAKLTGLGDDVLSAIKLRVGNGTYLLNSGGGSPVNFPMGLSTTMGGAPATLAVMGISFRSSCTNMNVLYDLNLPDIGGWLALAGTGLSIGPNAAVTGSGGVLYLPQDKSITAGGVKYTIDGCPGAGAGAVDTSKGTYIAWNVASGMTAVIANADIQFTDGSAIVAVDKNDQRLTTPAAIHARFSFSDWNDWVATAVLSNDFELAGLPGFPIHSDGLFFDHSTAQNPAGTSFPTGYTGTQGVGFEGLYIPSLSMGLPANFKTFSGGTPGAINFTNFILDNTGVTTSINATNILDISSGSLGGWAFSIDKIGIAIINNNFQSGMSMSGKVRLPISSDGLAYNCALNNTDGKVDYQFVVQPSGELNIPLWVAQLNLDPNSSLVISSDPTGMSVKTHLNGSIGITIDHSGMPKVTLPALSFQDMAMANRADTSAGAGAGFFFSPGKWSLGGGVPIPASFTGAGVTDGDVASGPNVGSDGMAGQAMAAPYDGGSSQGTVAGFSLSLSDFKPYFNVKSLSDCEAGVYFTVKVGIGFGDASVISGSARLGILGDIQIPGNASPSASFEKVDCDSVSIDGGVGPVQVHGTLAFRNGDETYGDGISGTLSADFTFAQLNAAAQFGTTLPTAGNYHYWAIGGSIMMDAGVPIGPGLFVNGFGGGAFHNMNLTPVGDNDIRSHPSTSPGTIPMVPQNNTDGIQAELIVSVIEPSVCNASLTLTGTIVNGGLGQLRMDGSGYVVTNAPSNSDALVSSKMTMVYDFVQRTFDLNVSVNVQFLVANAYGTLWMHGGPDGDYLYVGQPDVDKRITLELIKIGSDGDALYVDLGANAYFDAGTELPAFPALPDDIAKLQGDKSGNDNAVSTMLQIIGNAKPPNPGFMFGADIHGAIHLNLLFLYAKVDAELGFDVALEHVANPPAGCVQPDGSFGLNNWYGMGQFYAYFDLAIGLHVDAWFFNGNVDLVEEEAWCVLQGGLPNPSWVDGEVHVEGSALGGLVSVSGDFPFSFGDKCSIPFNPLDDIQMITDIGPKDSASVFADPSAAYSVPMNAEDYGIQVPSDDNHPNPYTRTFRFSVAQFKLFKMEPDGSDSLTAGQDFAGGFAMTDDALGSSLYPKTMLQPHTKYKMYVQCQVQELANNALVTPAGSSGFQDTTYFFTTGSAPDHIVPENTAYSYPIIGQRYFLKNEFGQKGTVEMAEWQYNILPASTAVQSADGLGYNYIVYFISSKGDTTTTSFTLNQPNNSVDFPIPAAIRNNEIYDLQLWVKPQHMLVGKLTAGIVSHTMAQTTNQGMNRSVGVDTKGNFVAQQSTLISSVAVAKNFITLPTTSHALGTIPIYTSRFQTSQYSSFADKMAAYGQWTSKPEDASRDIQLAAAGTPEEFDEFEIKGIPSTCQDCDPDKFPTTYPAIFGASIPWNNVMQNDKFASDNVYANTFQLPFFTVTTDLGAPEVRDGMIPDKCVSTELMPYQPKLAPLNIQVGAAARTLAGGSSLVASPTTGKSSGGSGSKGAQVMVKAQGASMMTLRPTSTGGGSTVSSNATIFLPVSYATGSGANAVAPPATANFMGISAAPMAIQPSRLVWKHDNYIYADYALLQQFANNFLSNQQQLIYMPGLGTIPLSLANALSDGNDVTLATGEYGSISMGAYQYGTKYNDPSLTRIANAVKGVPFQPLPASTHSLQLKYSYPFCGVCSIGSTVPVSFNYGVVIQAGKTMILQR